MTIWKDSNKQQERSFLRLRSSMFRISLSLSLLFVLCGTSCPAAKLGAEPTANLRALLAAKLDEGPTANLRALLAAKPADEATANLRILLAANPPAKSTKAKSAGQNQEPASSVKLYGQVDELLSACANAGVEITSTTLPARIQKVRMGSPAFYGGLQDNDVILKGKLDNGRLNITFRRGAAIYAIDLATEARADTPSFSLKTAASPQVALTSGTEEQTKDPAWKKLKNYEIVMLIDQSGSMGEPADTKGTSKWDWCKKQLSNFATQAAENTGRRFTIVTFNSDYNVRRDCSPQQVEETFVDNAPGGATELAAPLDFVLKEYDKGQHKSPLLVVVLTDGVPATPELVEKSIVDATKRMSAPDQIKVVFFEIGNDPDGANLIKFLDVGLTSEGARYDIVDANSFEQLQKVGLKTALYDTFNHNGQSAMGISGTSHGHDLQSELDAIRKELQQARARSGETPSNR